MDDEGVIAGGVFSAVFFIALIMVFTCIGVLHLVMDYRHFGYIKEDCEKRGYIQNETIRINCSVEKQNG